MSVATAYRPTESVSPAAMAAGGAMYKPNNAASSVAPSSSSHGSSSATASPMASMMKHQQHHHHLFQQAVEACSGWLDEELAAFLKHHHIPLDCHDQDQFPLWCANAAPHAVSGACGHLYKLVKECMRSLAQLPVPIAVSPTTPPGLAVFSSAMSMAPTAGGGVANDHHDSSTSNPLPTSFGGVAVATGTTTISTSSGGSSAAMRVAPLEVSRLTMGLAPVFSTFAPPTLHHNPDFESNRSDQQHYQNIHHHQSTTSTPQSLTTTTTMPLGIAASDAHPGISVFGAPAGVATTAAMSAKAPTTTDAALFETLPLGGGIGGGGGEDALAVTWNEGGAALFRTSLRSEQSESKSLSHSATTTGLGGLGGASSSVARPFVTFEEEADDAEDGSPTEDLFTKPAPAVDTTVIFTDATAGTVTPPPPPPLERSKQHAAGDSPSAMPVTPPLQASSVMPTAARSPASALDATPPPPMPPTSTKSRSPSTASSSMSSQRMVYDALAGMNTYSSLRVTHSTHSSSNSVLVPTAGSTNSGSGPTAMAAASDSATLMASSSVASPLCKFNPMPVWNGGGAGAAAPGVASDTRPNGGVGPGGGLSLIGGIPPQLQALHCRISAGDANTVSQTSYLPPTSTNFEKVGKYLLMDKIGAGQQGEVYRAVHIDTMQECAVKVFQPPPTSAENRKSLWEQQVQELSVCVSFNHPHIVQGIEIVKPPGDGPVYLVMQLARGGSAANLRPDGQCSTRPLSDLKRLAAQAANALKYLHMLKVAHRDIKPDNMLLDEKGNLLLSDFGVCTVQHNTHDGNTEGTSGGDEQQNAPVLLQGQGAMAFRAPEEFDTVADKSHGALAAIDMWSLGVVLYAMTFGELPFPGKTYCKLRDEIRAGATFPPGLIAERRRQYPGEDLDSWIDAVLTRLLTVEPGARMKARQLAGLDV